MRDIEVGEELTAAYCSILDSAAERAKDLASDGIFGCGCGPSCSDPAVIKTGDERRAQFRSQPVIVFQSLAPSPDGEAPDAWVQPVHRRLQELEEEGVQACGEFSRALFQLVNIYSYLQDVEKVMMYAKKIKGVYRVEGKDFPAQFYSAKGIKRSPYYQMREMQKSVGGSMPAILMTFG
ncbi:hypothetical protein D9757_011346 [Collybiopsis confluens]|uniref:Uncharacterized protein n=1 Tax=Collybiopsis confluens TaxID=2823264 RepID=A0A8H5GGR6_9AGAR|nr:hypothetical protein D9757_011346 [Collybiopsis confluens]